MVDFGPFCVSFNAPKAKDLHGKVTDVLENSLNVSKALININNALTTFYDVAITAKDIHRLILETEDSGFDVNVFAIKMKTIENVINFIGQRLGLRFASKLWNVIIIFVSIVWLMTLNDLTRTLVTTSRQLK